MIMTRRSFGYIRRLPSKRYQASYLGPDLARHAAPDTLEAKMDAEGWLRDERKIIGAGEWIPELLAPRSPERAVTQRASGPTQSVASTPETLVG
jgi:hypothetical protein